MKRFKISTQTTYKKNGEEKKYYPEVGKITQFDDGGLALDLNMFPDTKFYVFEDKPKEAPKMTDEQVEEMIQEEPPF